MVLQLVQVSVPPAVHLLWEIPAPFPFFQPSLSAPLFLPEASVHLCCIESTGSTAAIYITKGAEISGVVVGPFKMLIESF